MQTRLYIFILGFPNTHPSDVPSQSSIRRNLELGSKVTTASYIQSRRELDALRRAIAKTFSNIDVLVTPTTTVPPITIEEALGQGVEFELIRNRNTSPFNVYGLPAISIPCGFTSKGLPIGLQIIGPRFGEAKLLAVAHAYEQVTDWHTKRPGASDGIASLPVSAPRGSSALFNIQPPGHSVLFPPPPPDNGFPIPEPGAPARSCGLPVDRLLPIPAT